jgi:hypothetical protein
MSETSIFPGADDESAAAPLDDVDGREGTDRRKLMMVGGAVGVVIVLVAAYFVLHKSSSPAPVAGAATPVVSTSPTATPAASHKAKIRKLPKVAKQGDVRDPFTALITAPVVTGNQPQSTTTVSSSPNPTTSAPTPSTSDSSAPVVVISSPPSTAPPVSESTPDWIQLMKVKGQVATFDVGYPNHKFKQFIVTAPKPTATTGTVFDKIFTLIGVESGEASRELATIQIGDASPFDLPTGVSHTI